MGREDDTRSSATRNTARMRFAIIGPLLASPPPKGGLQAALRVRDKPSSGSPASVRNLRAVLPQAISSGSEPTQLLRHCHRSTK